MRPRFLLLAFIALAGWVLGQMGHPWAVDLALGVTFGVATAEARVLPW